MELKQNQKQGIGLFLAGAGSILGVSVRYLPDTYRTPALLIAALILIAGVTFVFKSSR